MTGNKRPGQAGFTMIEIAVVLLIIAIVSAFVVPQVVSYMRAYKLGVAARNVATALQRARFLATSNNTRAGIVVSDVNRVDIEQYDVSGGAEPQNKGVVNLPDGVKIAEGPRALAFDGRGIVTPIPKENAVLRINGFNGYYMFVTVSPTGQVTLSETKHDQT
ncbi:MAG TPA: prepilin-type N-terminal cleavage/methylation domain-containing protein [Blastocatellia bacterium]|nr:prepilin-type N-terminal cleavage/methylation domain-containing protein [Blastocatellia bacterium]